MAISVSRFQAIKNAFKRAYSRSFGRLSTDQSYSVLAKELKEVFPPASFGNGPVSGTDTVSQIGDLYCDRLTGQFYQYQPSGWAVMASDGGGGSYVLPVATPATLGGVKVGSGLDVDPSGLLTAPVPTIPTSNISAGGTPGATTYLRGDGVWANVDNTYTLPTASPTALGGVKVGANLAIDGGGVMSAAGDMTKAYHRTSPPTENHVVHGWEVANSAARLALTPTSADIGRIARQLDDESLWQCTGVTPARWRPIDIRRSDRGMPWVLFHRTTPVNIVAPPGTILLNEIVDLGKWGTVCDQYRVQFDAVATVLDGGVRRAACGPEEPYNTPLPPGIRPTGPAGDPPVTGIYVATIPLMNVAGTPEEAADPVAYGVAARPAIPTQEEIDANSYEFAGSMGVEAGNYGPENKCRFVRLFIARTSTPLTPEQETALATHQVHINVTGADNVVGSWDIPIPATQNTLMMNQLIDLRDYSASGPLNNFTFVLEFLRGGQLINLAHPVTWEGQADFDPPTYPIRVNFSGWVDTTTKDYDYNANNTKLGPHLLNVYGELGGAYRFDGGIWVGQKIAYCTENMRSLIRLQVWRDVSFEDRDGDGATTYIKTPGSDPIAIPAGAKDNCTVRVKLIRAPEMCQGLYPFTEDGMRPSTWGHQSRIITLENKMAQHDATILGAIKNYDVSSSPLPNPDSEGAGHFAIRSDSTKPGSSAEPLMAMPGLGWIRIGHLAVKGDWNSGPQTGTGSMLEHSLPVNCWSNPEVVEVVPLSWPAGAAFQPVVNVVPCVLYVSPAKIQVTVAAGVVYEVRTFGWTAP